MARAQRSLSPLSCAPQTAEEEAKRYSEMILAMAEKAKMPMDPVTDMPQFDLILVGMGADGHVGSLYPGDDALKAPEGTMVVPNIKGDGSQSITFTPHLMSSCQRAVICCTGASKAAAVRMALEEPDRAVSVALMSVM